MLHTSKPILIYNYPEQRRITMPGIQSDGPHRVNNPNQPPPQPQANNPAPVLPAIPPAQNQPQPAQRPLAERRVAPSVNAPSHIPDDIDCGIRADLEITTYQVAFANTPKSIKPKLGGIGDPVQSRDHAKTRPQCLASGSNGCVETFDHEGRETIVKRSYGFIDEDITCFPDACGIVRESGVLQGIKEHASDHSGFKHIVPYLGSCVTDAGEPLIFLEKADSSLSDRLKEKPLSLNETLAYGEQLFSALACLESLNLVHQDIKPDNILLKDGELWLADFGETTSNQGFASRSLTGEQLDTNERRAGTLEIKPFHASFEAPQPAADIWAAGLVMLTMLNPKAMTDDNRAILKQLHDYPHQNKPFDQLTPKQYTGLHQQVESVSDKLIHEALHKETDRKKVELLTSLMESIFDPDASKRITAQKTVKALQMIQKPLLPQYPRG